MKNLVKLLGIIAIGVIIGFSLAGCGDGGGGGDNSGGGNDIVIILDSNAPYGWQKTYEPASLFNGAKIVQGDKYTFTYSFKSNVAIDKLQVLFVDNCQATGYDWNVISNYVVIEENIAANTVVSGTVTITASGTATDATALANRLVFQAGTGTSQQPTLTFTTLNLVKEVNNGGGTAPNTPTGVTATAQSSSSISISWSSVSGATGYYIYRSSSSSGTYTQVGTESSTSYTDTGLSASTTYYYKVAAYNSNGTSSQSSYDYATTQSSGGGGTAPSAPTGVSATAQSSSSISVSWNAVSGATSYDVYYEIGNSSTKNFAGNTTSTSYTHTGLTASTTYYYYIKAKNSSGDSGYSSFDFATTQSSGGGGTAPSTPTGVTATANSSSSITVSWSSVSGATGYYIYRSSSASGTYTQVGTSTSTSYQNTGLSASTTYYYKVAAYNSSGTSSQSSYDYATTQASVSIPSAPTGVTASKNPRSSEYVTISWNAVSGATSYRIYYSMSATGTYQQVTNVTGLSTERYFYNDGTSYWKVSAVNSAGESALSSTYGTALGWQQ